MGRLVSPGFAFLILVLMVSLTGCGTGPKGTTFPVPAAITITPANNVSLDLGTTQSFTPSLRSFNNRPINGEPVTFESSNAAVVTIATIRSGTGFLGLACAGTWDSLTNPQICTAGPTGVAQITATAMGVTSPPVTIYVHQHVDNVTVSLVPTNPPTTTTCVSKGLTARYQARALSRGVDVTSTVGPFTWSAFNPTVVMLNNTLSGLNINEVQVTGGQPGNAQIFASAAGVNSVPLQVQTCLVQSISLQVANTGATSFSVNVGGSDRLAATVTDTQGNLITGVPLTWSSSNAGVVTVNSTSGAVSTPNAGGAAITASCTPPSCNIGVSPIQPIYSNNVITATVSRSGTTTPSGTVWTTTHACQAVSGCFSNLFSIVFPSNTVATQTRLPAVPNSLVFTPTGTTAFLGTDQSLLGTKGLMMLNPTTTPPSVNMFPSVTGKVLAISNDGTRLILSNTTDIPNQVFVVDASNIASGINAIPLQITGATAAAFSPDGLKAFILAGNTLYVHSTVEPLQTIPLAASPTAVSFLSEGAFAYIAGESTNTVTVRKTCDNTIATDASNSPQVIATPSTPWLLQTLPNSTQVLGVNSPGIDLIPITGIQGASGINVLGCSPGLPNISNGIPAFFNLGQGSFTPTQLLISSDSTRAYVLTNSLPTVLVFDTGNQTSSAIALAGSALPQQASLTTDGTMLYVGASDGLVHVLDTAMGADVAQVMFPTTTGLCVDSTGMPFMFNPAKSCDPDLIAVRP